MSNKILTSKIASPYAAALLDLAVSTTGIGPILGPQRFFGATLLQQHLALVVDQENGKSTMQEA